MVTGCQPPRPVHAAPGVFDFNIVVDRYPNSRYAADARQRMLELRDVFAQHELDNALYYMRRGAWVSAGRANYLLETYPQSAFQYDATVRPIPTPTWATRPWPMMRAASCS